MPSRVVALAVFFAIVLSAIFGSSYLHERGPGQNTAQQSAPSDAKDFRCRDPHNDFVYERPEPCARGDIILAAPKSAPKAVPPASPPSNGPVSPSAMSSIPSREAIPGLSEPPPENGWATAERQMRSLCGDLYGTPACMAEWGPRGGLCAEYEAAAMYAFNVNLNGERYINAVSDIIMSYHLPDSEARSMASLVYSGTLPRGTTVERLAMEVYNRCMSGLTPWGLFPTRH